MKVVYSDAHLQHEPLFEIEPAGVVPHPETPARAERIIAALRASARFEVLPPHSYGPEPLRHVHAPEYLDYLESAYSEWIQAGLPESGVIPDAFAPPRAGSRPRCVRGRAGRFCLDTGTPITPHTWAAARSAAAVALTAAGLLLEGDSAVYALCRPPGHHAGRDYCGGFCYLNNAAVAAARLLEGAGPRQVAILDIDYHHGNGTQDIFYESGDLLYVSVHADTFEADPIGGFTLPTTAFGRMGADVAALGVPMLIVQEGGYDPDGMPECVRLFLEPLSSR